MEKNYSSDVGLERKKILSFANTHKCLNLAAVLFIGVGNDKFFLKRVKFLNFKEYCKLFCIQESLKLVYLGLLSPNHGDFLHLTEPLCKNELPVTQRYAPMLASCC